MREDVRKRNASVEVYRVLLMFGICLIHAIGISWWRGDSHFNKDIAAVFQFCVGGFVLISGYFGIRFGVAKIVRLCGVGVYAAVVATLLGLVVGTSSERSVVGVVIGSYRTYCTFWFLHAYVLLMCIAPVINGWIESCSRLRDALIQAVPFLIVIFGWSFAVDTKLFGVAWPTTSGFGSMTGLTLLAYYVVGRVYGKFEKELHVSGRGCGLAFALGGFLAYCGLGFINNSPICLLMALSSFVLIKGLNVPSAVSLIARLLGPSMFAVYLIHTNCAGWVLIGRMRACFANHGVSMAIAWFCVAAVLFGGGLILDALRRIFVSMMWRIRSALK